MTKEKLLGSICLADAINECCSEDANSDTSCEKCELEMSIMLDKFAKQIRADAIDECIELIIKIMPAEPFLKKSKHYENWKMKTTELRMLRDMVEQLKEQK